MSVEALQTAVDFAGGQSALGRAIGKKQSDIWSWLNVTKKAPAEFVIAIENAVDRKVTRHQLRPDIYPIDQYETTQSA